MINTLQLTIGWVKRPEKIQRPLIETGEMETELYLISN